MALTSFTLPSFAEKSWLNSLADGIPAVAAWVGFAVGFAVGVGVGCSVGVGVGAVACCEGLLPHAASAKISTTRRIYIRFKVIFLSVI